MGDDDPFGSYGLSPILIEHKPVFDRQFSACSTRLSDYTFANTFIWRDSIHLRWRMIRDCLCVFANGDGGLTMLFPPLGSDPVGALRECMDICADYNRVNRFEGFTRIEYVSDDLLAAIGGGFQALAMSGDYVYRTARMIDLAGGDLASKRQARNRFARRYAARTEVLERRHVSACLGLLSKWTAQGDMTGSSRSSVGIKRAKEVAATADALVHAEGLGLTGLVLYADEQMVGFTLGERIGHDTCSIVVEKTDRDFVGSANYIFSEFCRQCWADTTWCNVGDDWDVPSLAWTKGSYRPEHRLGKWLLRPVEAATSAAQVSVEPIHRVIAHAAAEVVTAGAPGGHGRE